jgi:hypothetical protein
MVLVRARCYDSSHFTMGRYRFVMAQFASSPPADCISWTALYTNEFENYSQEWDYYMLQLIAFCGCWTNAYPF